MEIATWTFQQMTHNFVRQSTFSIQLYSCRERSIIQNCIYGFNLDIRASLVACHHGKRTKTRFAYLESMLFQYINNYIYIHTYDTNTHIYIIVGKGGHPSPLFQINTPFSKIPLFLEIQDVPTFHRLIKKTKVLNNFCNRFVYNFYPQSILVLEECLKKW